MTDHGIRFNKGKPKIHLIPGVALLALAKHYTVGIVTHGPRNWEKGLSWCETYDSLQRHCFAWISGEDKDPETGSHHMIAAAWNAIALFCMWLWGKGTDDRARWHEEFYTLNDYIMPETSEPHGEKEYGLKDIPS